MDHRPTMRTPFAPGTTASVLDCRHARCTLQNMLQHCGCSFHVAPGTPIVFLNTHFVLNAHTDWLY
jgi:hypothetical protein